MSSVRPSEMAIVKPVIRNRRSKPTRGSRSCELSAVSTPEKAYKIRRLFVGGSWVESREKRKKASPLTTTTQVCNASGNGARFGQRVSDERRPSLFGIWRGGETTGQAQRCCQDRADRVKGHWICRLDPQIRVSYGKAVRTRRIRLDETEQYMIRDIFPGLMVRSHRQLIFLKTGFQTRTCSIWS